MTKWIAFLSKNLKYPDRAGNEEIAGLVWTIFTVDEKGIVGEIYLGRSVEYSIDREVQRVIRKSGKWMPGEKNGLPVKTWKLQPVDIKLR